MSDNITPNNPNTPPAPSTVGNIASLISPLILSNLKSASSPKAFGQQLTNTAKQQVVQAAAHSTIAMLYEEKAFLIKEGITLDVTHQYTLLKLQQENTPAKRVENGQTVDIPPKINNEEYTAAVVIENTNYALAKKNLQERKDKNQKNIDDYLKDPFAKQKAEKKKRQAARMKAKSRTKAEKKKARKDKSKAVLKNAKKSLVPILTLLLTNKIAELIAQNDKIKELVDKTNAIIIDANQSGDQTKLNNAKLARDTAIKIIQNNEAKITKINTQISQIAKYINIFSIIVNIISAIPIPTAVPPGIGIPVNLIMKLVKILQKASDILLALSALIPILTTTLDKAITILEDYKAQLLEINGQLDKAAVSGNPSTSTLSNVGVSGADAQFGSFPTEYKGFKFAIREENNPKFNVRGNKRHYAVAIDVDGVEVLKSESSFTLDPNDLIEQLKLTIDDKDLYTGTGNNPQPGNSDNAVQDFMKVNSPENINALISSTQQQQSSQASQAASQQQQQIQAAATQAALTTRPPLTPQQKSYYTRVYFDLSLPQYERQNARAILDRNYI